MTFEITNALWYKIAIKVFECFAGVMIGREIIFKKLAKSGKQIIGITFVQSIGTFLVVSATFCAVFAIAGIPFRLGFIFGGIALATAPAPALSIVNEYKTDGPVTKTLIPLAALDDVIGVVVFFTVIAIVSSVKGVESVSPWQVVAIVLMPFAIGIVTGVIAGSTLNGIDASLASIVSGTIVAAAIINEIIAVITAKIAFRKAGEISGGGGLQSIPDD